MNKLFIGLLLAAAAGTGIYFYLNNKKEKDPTGKDNKELILGKWKTVNYEPVADTTQPLYQYHFQKEGKLYRQLSDTAKADTLYYEWGKSGELVMKRNASDTITHVYNINQLVADTLKLKPDNKSYLIHLQRIK